MRENKIGHSSDVPQVAALGEISGGDAAKSGKIFLAPQGRRGQVSRLNRDLGPNCGALRARRYAPGATRHDLGPFEGFGPKIFSRPKMTTQVLPAAEFCS